jgi:hypothetical protein
METCTDSHKFEHEIKEAQETYQEKRQKYIDKRKK